MYLPVLLSKIAPLNNDFLPLQRFRNRNNNETIKDIDMKNPYKLGLGKGGFWSC